MSNSDKNQNESALVKSVLALDNYLSELERVGTKISTMKMSSEFDLEHMRKLMGRFAECGQGVSVEVTGLSNHLNEARARAEAVAKVVAERADILNDRKSEQHEKLDQFRLLGEKVRALNTEMSNLRPPEGAEMSPEDRTKLSLSLVDFDAKLQPLIDEAQTMKKDAQEAKMKTLEQNADSLAQTLLSVRKKLRMLNPTGAV